MKLIKSELAKLFIPFGWFWKRSLVMKLVIIAVLVGIGWFAIPKLFWSKTSQPQYQTAQAEIGTIIVSVNASGQITSASSAFITTEASGVVKNLYAKDGDTVKSGDKIADIDLDLVGKQKADQAFASYQSAKNSVESAKAAFFTLQSDMFTKWKTFLDLAQSGMYQNGDGTPRIDQRQLPQFMSTNDDWLATEAKYKNQQGVLAQAQTSLNSTWLSYQQSSPTIVAPISGTVTGLSLQVGSVITTNVSSTTNTVSAQKIASIKTSANPTVTINLTEIDVPKIKIGNKATVTLDAFADKTYTGKVVSIDTVGTVSSGVTTYPTVIQFDTQSPNILSNMSAQASIITEIKDNALLVPASAVQSQNGTQTVSIMRNGLPQQVPVETGLASDTQIEITSGLSVGDTIVTGTTTANINTAARGQTQSVFSGFGAGSLRGVGGGQNRAGR